MNFSYFFPFLYRDSLRPENCFKGFSRIKKMKGRWKGSYQHEKFMNVKHTLSSSDHSDLSCTWCEFCWLVMAFLAGMMRLIYHYKSITSQLLGQVRDFKSTTRFEVNTLNGYWETKLGCFRQLEKCKAKEGRCTVSI